MKAISKNDVPGASEVHIILKDTPVFVDGERVLPLKDFYRGRKKLAARNALAISRVSFAGIFDIINGSIRNCATSFGAVSDVIIRLDSIDKMLVGKTIQEAKGFKDEYLKAFAQGIVPIRGRFGIQYRKEVCLNLLKDFLNSNGI